MKNTVLHSLKEGNRFQDTTTEDHDGQLQGPVTPMKRQESARTHQLGKWWASESVHFQERPKWRWGSLGQEAGGVTGRSREVGSY